MGWCEVAPTFDEANVPRRADYGFEKRQKELKRQQKKEEKAAKRLAKKEEGADAEPSGVMPVIDDLTPVRSSQPDAGEADPKADGVE